MHYLTDAIEIKNKINQFRSSQILWLDTEVADCRSPNPRLSLIQVLAKPDNSGESAFVFDVLDKPDLARYFIEQIMVNPRIEKVFHNASFDLKYLGGKLIPNVTCTLKIARKITRYKLETSNLKLKTLAAELCNFTDVDTESGASDWGKRPLIGKQLYYAAMDVVYLAAVHRYLLDFNANDENNIFRIAGNQNQNKSTQKNNNSYLTATKVRIAFECPRLFYLNDKFADKALFIPRNIPTGVGSIFHSFADEFVRLSVKDSRFKELFKPEISHLDVDTVALEMQQIFYKAKFYPYLQQVTKTDKTRAKPLLLVWQGLQSIIRHFAQILIVNRGYCSGSTVIRKTFVSEDRKLQHYFNLPNGTRQLVKGEYDCLIYNFERQRLCLIEFKTYQPIDPSAQLAQVSLYSYMLFQKKQLPFDSAVYCVLPEFKEYYYGWEELENTVNQLIPYKLQQMQEWLSWEPSQGNCPPATTQPYLCEICPQQEKCQSYFGDTVNTNQSKEDNRLQKTAEDAEDTEERSTEKEKQRIKSDSVDGDAVGQELVATLQSFGIRVNFIGVAVAPSFIRVKLKPQPGVKYTSIQKLYADLQIQMGLENPPLIEPQAGYVSVDLPHPDRKAALFDDYLKPQKIQDNASVKVAIGVNLEGKLIEADLSDPNTCHFLVGGTTGSGKSEFLRSQLLSLLIRYSPEQLKIALVDPKRVTFPEFEKMRWLYSSVVKDSEGAIELMDKLVGEMEFRYQRFEKTGCADLGTYNQVSHKPLPRIVCIFDEYADFMAEKESRSALEQSIKRLGAMARAAGIHLIIATQRPEARVVTPIIRSNLPGRIALRTASEADSMIVLGGKKTAAAYLLGKGDLLYQVGAKLHRLQSLYAKNVDLN